MFARKPGKGITLEMYIRNTQVNKKKTHNITLRKEHLYTKKESNRKLKSRLKSKVDENRKYKKQKKKKRIPEKWDTMKKPNLWTWLREKTPKSIYLFNKFIEESVSRPSKGTHTTTRRIKAIK